MAEKGKKRALPSNVSLDSKKQKEFNQKIQKVKTEQVKGEGPQQTGVVYISHLPWGFEEKPLRDYLSQFGKILKLRISRNKKTGNSRSYGYVQFANDKVAKIVADTMNNYLMFGKLIKCKHLSNPHPKTFKHARRTFKKVDPSVAAIKKHNSYKTPEALDKNTTKTLNKYKKLQKKLEALTGKKFTLQAAEEKIAEMKIKKEIMSDTEAGPEETDEPEKKKRKTESPKPAGKASQATNVDKQKVKTPKSVEKYAAFQEIGNKQLKTPRRKSIIPQVDTPQGKMNVLMEDSSDDDITFKTPPFSIKSSKLPDSLKKKLEAERAADSPKSPVGKVKSAVEKQKSPAVSAEKEVVSPSPVKESPVQRRVTRSRSKGLKTPPSLSKLKKKK